MAKSVQNFTLEDIKKSPVSHLNAHLFDQELEKKKRAKYNNQPVDFDGKRFDSTGECTRYILLRMLETSGEIKNLQHHFPIYELNPGGTYTYKYEPDFTYSEIRTGEFIVEDFKGKITTEFKKKQKLMLEIYGITIKITK